MPRRPLIDAALLIPAMAQGRFTDNLCAQLGLGGRAERKPGKVCD